MIGDGSGTGRDDIIEYLVEKGALSVTTIKELAAVKVQSWWKGSTTRRKYKIPKRDKNSKEKEDKSKKNKKEAATTPPKRVSPEPSLSKIEEERLKKEARIRCSFLFIYLFLKSFIFPNSYNFYVAKFPFLSIS
jgi:hypothetical protein